MQNVPAQQNSKVVASVEAAEGPVRAPEVAPARLAYRFFKRAFDVAFSLVVLMVCAFLWPAVLAVFAVSAVQCQASPIYSQRRVGKDGAPFGCLKLRTMVGDADDVGKYLDPDQLDQWSRERKVDADPRITKVGRILRKTSLDELPQFLNVLAGQMSVVGPRPVVQEELASYGGDAAEFLSMRPGITGWWQVSARNDATYADGSRQELELFYVRHASIAMDARVFAGTFGVMFGKERTGR